jgi:hypothetical protein
MLFFDPSMLCRYEAMLEARSTSNKIEHLQPSLISIKINSQDLIQLFLIHQFVYVRFSKESKVLAIDS